MRRLNISLIGADIVEVAPDLDLNGSTSLLAAALAYEMLFLMAQSAV
ncbi:MAG: arginase family protein [Firmicutes bacterium]|nr:arginase family protein [Bacillota bacterium]